MLEDLLRELQQAHDQWLAESLRLTSFPRAGLQLGEEQWWERATGIRPERRVMRPRRGGYQEDGELDGRRLVLSAQPSRIDWLLAPLAPGEEGPDLLTIGPLSEALPLFSRITTAWLGTAPALERLAFGAILYLPVDGIEDGNRRLDMMLVDLDIDPVRSRDLFYQINKPRLSTAGVADLRINRLSKWTVAQVQHVTVIVNTAARRTADVNEQQPPTTACRLELDINTDAGFRDELPRDRLVAIYEELAELGSEIVLRGDIP